MGIGFGRVLDLCVAVVGAHASDVCVTNQAFCCQVEKFILSERWKSGNDTVTAAFWRETGKREKEIHVKTLKGDRSTERSFFA